jgi:putative acetyltransferase
LIIRPESETDIESITRVTIEAFKNLHVSNQTEHFIIHALRDAGALKISLMEEMDEQFGGQIAFSPVPFQIGTVRGRSPSCRSIRGKSSAQPL